ncbi:MAG TPA: DUF3987 domain-containing protein [Coleofasciculaceae cyanobacterium]
MIAKIKTLSALQQRLIKGLELLPDDISLCLLNGKKIPQGKEWQKRPYSNAKAADAIAHGLELENSEGKKYRVQPQGYGLMAGLPITVNGEQRYLLIVDQNGASAKRKIEEMSGGDIPETVMSTSGRQDRCHRIYYVTEEYAPHLQSKTLATGELGEDGKPEHVEFLWLGRQAVLPPSVHPTTGEYTWITSPKDIEIAPAPTWVIEQMLKPQLKSAPQLKQPTTNKWSSVDWALSYLNALSPYRADDYDDWLTVGMALHSADDSLLTEWDKWSQQSSKYTPGCCDKKWKSFKKDGKSLGSLGHMAKQDGWRSPFEKSENPRIKNTTPDTNDSAENKVVKFPGFELLTIEQVTREIDNLVKQGVMGSQLTGELNRLATASQIYVGELRRLYYERLEECDLEANRTTNKDEADNLLAITEHYLNLDDYLPSSLSEPITQWCKWLNVRSEVALTALLGGVSSLHKVGTELVLHRNQNFRVPPTVYTGLVSNSGQKKSPIFNNIIRYPLNTLLQEKLDAYQAAMEDHEVALEQWEKAGKPGRKPEKPKDPTLYYFTNATGESIPVQAGKDPQKALLALIDELAGYFNSSNAYRSGRGSDKQDLLSYFDGMGQTILRAGGIKVDVPNIYLSIFGTIQPEVLKQHMEDCTDPDGNWARFLFVNQPLQAAVLSDDDGMAVQISERIASFYRAIDQLPEMEYYLSKGAFKRYQKIYNQLERLRVTHPKSGMAAVYSKMEGYIGRLALNLHVLWELDAGKTVPAEEIPLAIMEKAISLAKFYIGQVKLIHANCDDESIPTHVIKLIELSKRLEQNGKDGWIKAKAYCEQFAKKKRPKAQQAREWMLEAVALGHGKTRGTGNQLEFHWLGDNKTTIIEVQKEQGEPLGDCLRKDIPLAVTIDSSSVEDILGNLGNGSPLVSGNLFDGDTQLEEQEISFSKGGCFHEASPNGHTLEMASDTALGNGFPQGSSGVPLAENGVEETDEAAALTRMKFLLHTLQEIAEKWMIEASTNA